MYRQIISCDRRLSAKFDKNKKIPSRSSGFFIIQMLLNDLGNNAGTDRSATLTDSETKAFLDSDGLDQLDRHRDVVAKKLIAMDYKNLAVKETTIVG